MYHGSVFRKWDLHVHTPESFENLYSIKTGEKSQYGDNIWDKYIDALESLDDIQAVGITDYFCIDGYRKALEYRAKGRLQNIELILPNIEFRLDKFVKESRSINYHVIFSNDLSADDIQHDFLDQLKFEAAGGSKQWLTRHNIEEFGKSIKESQSRSKSDLDWVVGCKHIVVNLDDIIDVLKVKDIFKGKYILVLAEPEWAFLDWEGRDYPTRKNLLIKSDCIFSSNPNTRAWALGLKDTPQDIIAEFGSLKPCVHGSDCHKFENFCQPAMNRYCWIKADFTFEGLKQILYEPAERVIIQENNPESPKNIYTIISAKIDKQVINDELTMDVGEIGLNRNLTTIIGGKGSGKTAILDLIANCFEDRCLRGGHGREEERNSFVQRIEQDASNLSVNIRFLDPEIEPFSKKLTEERIFNQVHITYLPQGQIEEYSANREKLNEIIRSAIFNNKEVAAGDFENKFDNLSEQIDTLTEDISEINSQIYKLEKETTSEIIRELQEQLSIKNGELKNKRRELKEIQKYMDGKVDGKAKELRDKEQLLKTKKSKLDESNLRCSLLKQRLADTKASLNDDISGIHRLLSDFKLTQQIPMTDFTIQVTAMDTILEKIKVIEDEVIQSLSKVELDLLKLDGFAKNEAAIIKEIRDLEEIETSLKGKQKEIDTKKTEIVKRERIRKEKFVELMTKFIEWRQFYKQVINAFSSESSQILSGVKFESRVHFDRVEFMNMGEELFNLKSVNESEIKKFADIADDMIRQESKEAIETKISQYISEVFAHRNQLKIRRNSLDFYNWAFYNFYSLDTDIFFNNTHMDKLSIGQKGTVLLKIFLAEGDSPLIVDMPEENLDNKFIYDELVDAFRQAKTKRQLIIATNNANLVINTDAEEIIIAEFKDNVIKYKLGSIEDNSIRNEITTILEGGPEALRKREKKYGM